MAIMTPLPINNFLLCIIIIIGHSLLAEGVGAIATYDEAAGATDEEAVETTKFYPHFSSSTCLSDGLQPSWLQAFEIYDNVEDCCRNSFMWNKDCVAQSTPIVDQIKTHNLDGHLGPTTYQQASDGQSPKFFPIFESGLTTCRSQIDGTPASWLSVKDFKRTVSDCCRSYASNYDDCVTASYAALRYYPDFQTMSCVSEGTPGDWIAGDYFLWDEKQCCKAFFASVESSSCKELLLNPWV